MNQTLNPSFQVIATVAFVVASTSPPVWASDSSSVTIVAAPDGLTATITYVSAGTANITATASDGTVATAQVTTVPGTVTNSGTITFGTPTPVGGGGGSTLPATFSNASGTAIDDFAAAVAAYTGGQQVTLDGTEVKPGFGPPMAYLTGPNGDITMTGSVAQSRKPIGARF
ncbi:MAG TPA: hypothetical protein VHQ92_01040 [Pseudolabrys sp.]|nr:hypothetical protein [Pseudolabrys sp.]